MPVARHLRLCCCGLALAAGVAGAAPAAAQRQEPVLERAVRLPAAGGDALFLASAIVPGSAQLIMGDQRWVAYASAELWGLVSWFQQRRNAHHFAERYRDLAWRVARRTSEGERRDTVFEYYEAMAHYWSSGAWDVDPGQPGIQPERQAGTFNGDMWDLARALHGGPAAVPGTPEYDRALAYYQSRAIPPGYAWAWGASDLEQQVFVDIMAESDAAFRSASRYMGIILANHLTSAVDALVTSRLRRLGAGGVRMESGPARDQPLARWEYGLRVVF